MSFECRKISYPNLTKYTLWCAQTVLTLLPGVELQFSVVVHTLLTEYPEIFKDVQTYNSSSKRSFILSFTSTDMWLVHVK